MNKSVIALRPATADDELFVNQLIFTTMHEYVEATWPNDPGAHRHYYENNKFDPSNTRIIQVAGKDIGRLSTTRESDCLFVDELHILPQYQSHGIGRQAIEQVFREAQEKNLPVRLTVLVANRRAQKLYMKMGFKVIAEKDHRLHMQYWPQPS